ncbi:hypothetical protein Tco_0914844, partial [Tanacetum coccineum]
IQTQEKKIDTDNALDASLVVIKSSGTESEVQDESNKSGNDTNVDDVDIKPVYDEEPIAEEKSNESKVKNDIHVIEPINIELEHKVANLLKENEHLKAHIQEKVFATAALKNKLRKVTGHNVDTKFAEQSILGKLPLQPLRNQSVVRQPTAFKSE